MQITVILLAIIEIVLLVITLFDLLKRKFKSLAFGMVWLFIIFAFPFIGPLVYFFLREGMSAGRPRAFNPRFHREIKEGEA
jgi:hypothetical protein